MSNLNKIDVPVAVEHRTKLDLSHDSLSTIGFMTPQPVSYRHMIKGEHLNLIAETKVRPAPIALPLYGSIKYNLRYFFVPYRLVFPNWDSFYNDVIASNVDYNSIVSSPPTLSNSVLIDYFTNSSYAQSITGSATDFDFYYNSTYYKLTRVGRFSMKILQSLGYEVMWAKSAIEDYNALGLLAFMRVYLDWYANSQYLNSSDVLNLERIFKFNDPTSHYQFTSIALFSLLSLVGSCVYDTEDYYVNAWDNPVSPNSGQFTSFSFADPTSLGGTGIVQNSLGSPEMMQTGASVTSIGTTYLHEALKKLSDFQKRHALAGARSIDRVLAQYGFISDSLKQGRSLYLGSQSTLIDIGSVVATSDSSNGSSTSSVGEYAGFGYGKNDGSMDFKCDEEGVFLVIASVIPSGKIVQGYDRNNFHLNKFDFFVPEMDALGVQAIEKGEVYVSSQETFVGSDHDYRGIFGFSGRYGEYKRPKSFLVGDLRLNTLVGNSAWHLMRLFSDGSFGSVSGLVHSLAFTRGGDSLQYNRIFQYTAGDYDPFYCFIHFNMSVLSPCRPLFESYEFDSESKKVPTENGNKVN